MIKLFSILVLALPFFAFGGGMRFATELSKNKIYEGEQILCHFVLYASDAVLNVEVQKFPEFRGFWSENLALRQGPLGLMPSDDPRYPRKILIGTYSITPMVGRTGSRLTPMHIVIKPMFESALETIEMQSEAPELAILPLPPLPAGMTKEGYSGAVGNFAISIETPQIPFDKEEPVNVKFTLQGDGNFPEINRIPVPFPSDIEVLSRRSFLHGSGPFGTKSFEISLQVRRGENFELPGFPFLFFEPRTGKYETRTTSPLSFFYAPKPKTVLSLDEAEVIWPDPYRTWTAYSLWSQTLWFWSVQGLLTALLGLAGLAKLGKRWQNRPALLHRRLQQARFQVLQEKWKSGDTAAFLSQAESFTAELLANTAPGASTAFSRRELLKISDGHLPAPALQAAGRLFASHQSYNYSPQKSLLQTPEQLWRDLNLVWKAPIRHKQVEKLKNLAGTIELEIDIPSSRRRSRK